MTPILYESTETEFKTNGLGRLSNAVSCEVTEERNGAYELEMVYPVDGVHYKDITYSRIIFAKPSDGKEPQPFRIYNISRPMNGKTTVRAEHISYQMSDIPVIPFTAGDVNTALSGLSKFATEKNPFEFWTDKQTVAEFSVETPQSMRSLLGGVQGSILDCYGGEWEFDRYTARLWNQRGRDNGVTIRYGKNLTDIKQEESIAETYTGICPYWKGTVETEGSESKEEIVTLDEKNVYSENAKNFPTHKTKVIDFSQQFKEKPTQEQLRSATQSYIKSNNIGVPKVSISVSFIPLWQTEEYKDMIGIEHVNLCDTIHVEFPDLGVSATAKVNKTVYDVLTDRYTSIELGDARSTLADNFKASLDDAKEEIASQYTTKTALQQSVDRASKMITGGLGGYVVLKQNADGQPEEILVLGDSPIYTEAQKVWRWNKNGLAYSSTGYDGEFRTAITADGHIVADFMDTGNLTANVVKSGLLTDKNRRNYWNLDTGEFHLGAGKNGSYYGTQAPTDGNYPANIWNSAEDLQEHLGDIYYDTSTGRAYRWAETYSPTVKIKFSDKSKTESVRWGYVKIYYKFEGKTYVLPALGGEDISGAVVYVPTNQFWLYWHSDSSNHNYYGFSIDSISDFSGHVTVDSSEADLPNYQAIEASGGSYPESTHNYSDNEDKLWKYTTTNQTPTSLSYDWVEMKDLADNCYTKAEIDVKEGKIRTSIQDACNKYTDGQLESYVTTSTFNQTANSITTEVNKKVNNSDFGTKIEQNAESVKIAWNNISKYIQFENAGLNIYDSAQTNHKLVTRFDYDGEHFWRDGYEVGKIGTNNIAADPEQKGLVFDLEQNGAYMTWAADDPNTDSGKYITKWTYVQKGKGWQDYTEDQLHAGCPINMHSNRLIDVYLDNCGVGANKRFVAYNNSTVDFYTNVDFHNFKPKNLGGSSGTVNFVRVEEMSSDGTADVWHSGDYITFENGLFTGGRYG